MRRSGFSKNSKRIFNISPAFAAKTTWDLDVDGPLVLDASATTYIITPLGNFDVPTKVWGPGSTNNGSSYLGACGGAAVATVRFQSGVAMKMNAGTIGSTGVPGVPGGGVGARTFGALDGSGFSGLRNNSDNASILIAGGAGGPGYGNSAGPGGGTTGGISTSFVPSTGHVPAGQTSGGTNPDGGGSGTFQQGGTGDSYSGGGGGGHYGGAGGGSTAGGGGGGGGGSGYAHPVLCQGATLYTGTTTNPGNNSDPDKGTAGNIAAGGRVRLA